MPIAPCPTTPIWRAITVLAHAQQDATWNRQQISNQLRSLLREYYPAVLDAFAAWTNGLCRPEARELLKLAPHRGRPPDPPADHGGPQADRPQARHRRWHRTAP